MGQTTEEKYFQGLVNMIYPKCIVRRIYRTCWLTNKHGRERTGGLLGAERGTPEIRVVLDIDGDLKEHKNPLPYASKFNMSCYRATFAFCTLLEFLNSSTESKIHKEYTNLGTSGKIAIPFSFPTTNGRMTWNAQKSSKSVCWRGWTGGRHGCRGVIINLNTNGLKYMARERTNIDPGPGGPCMLKRSTIFTLTEQFTTFRSTGTHILLS
ncbi:hypothetical protein EDD18DRAFT_604403 [Armillaria luteobubalina]|uniref:Uncharacterized protein n=1 Tax=Armillaria luteobubalina TaxID=153913 RepID=A0AA39V2A8_9AGAR|nr:hypothetical protein EDD18DRAFT_604403 [Armillaria luteobubalina]